MSDRYEIPGFSYPDETGAREIVARIMKATKAANERAMFEALGLKANSVHVALKKNQVQAAWITAAVIRHGASADWLLFGHPRTTDDPDGVVILPITRFEGDTPTNKPDSTGTVDWFPFRRSWLKSRGDQEHLVLIRAEGDSMEPTISPKSLVLLNTALREVHAGGIFAVTFNRGLHLKRLQTAPAKLILQPDNKHYKDIEIDLIQGQLPESIKIIGRAVNWWHNESL